MMRLDINLPQLSYPIFIGPGSLMKTADSISQACPDHQAVVVTDENVWKFHHRQLEELLRDLNITYQAIVVKPGENSKSLNMLGYLYKEFYRFGLYRSEPVIAFGGGVVGDLAGFAAATYMRGVPFIQIPTTLLAQVDASVGGKVAVNLAEGKNLVGSFYQPLLVIADTQLLSTLPEREFSSGMAEVVKYAAIGNNNLLEILNNSFKLTEKLTDIIYLSCQSKAGFVEQDEKDFGARMMLNFGHTFGHAIEKYTGYEKYSHGEAVAMGMMLAAQLGVVLNETEPDTASELSGLLDSFGLKVRFEGEWEHIVAHMAGDKKNHAGDITLVLLRKMGSPFLYKINPKKLKQLLWEDMNIWKA